MKLPQKPFSFRKFAREVKPFISASYSAELARIVRPFFSESDSDEMRALKLRYIAARRQLATAEQRGDKNCALLAGWIHSLSGMLEVQPKPGARKMREILIEHVTAWLGPALLEAAIQGRLAEVARLLDRRRCNWPAMCSQPRVIEAYMKVVDREKRRPLIGELLRQLGINKPNRTKDNMQEWFRVNSRERVIRDTLKKFDLPLARGKRGRPR